MVQVRELTPKKANKLTLEQYNDQIKKMRKEGEKMVKGKFEFTDAQGGWLEFTMRMLPGEPIQFIKLIHGEVCDLPMSIVKHLNNTVKKVRKPMATMEHNSRGVPATFEIQSRVKFIPLDMF